MRQAAIGRDGSRAVERQLTDALDAGAVAVKVWKDIGMQQRDADGRAVMIDDRALHADLSACSKREAPSCSVIWASRVMPGCRWPR